MKILSAIGTAGVVECSKIQMQTIGKRDVGLYFHIPFCSKKCPYCHFFVVPDTHQLKKPFVNALLREWKMRAGALEGMRIVSIYFGGGTPTKLPPSDYAALIEALRASSIEFASECEITLEANPEDITLERMREYKAAGINRVSMGVQSLQPSELITLGRGHSPERSLEAVAEIHAAGITNISIDLMFELPGQTLLSWKKTLQKLSTLPITHLSLYNLTIEPHTLFHKQQKALQPHLPSDEERLKMLEHAVAYLPTIGLERYEISAFARNGALSRHNTGYWLGRPFLGFGPSAFSYFSGERFSNFSHYNRYLQAIEENLLPTEFKEKLPYPRNVQELFAVQLRLCKGVDMGEFAAAFGPLPEECRGSIQSLVLKGWLEREGPLVRLTSQGQLFYDSVATELI